ncbi:unnamed protein product [Rotaria magnacalcarata]|uniref:HTH OST-type domain-containing protein n=3 Tax=Rotaria magnacalcarata TaxID=392030 RepID=A0A816T2Y0_9BILA|nr:unnamed protein product [Rotaria magnacalcarata]CAF1626792.1 unnamed protein product [Rotaria magnacalcarata]CAF2061935.1 unnamed protein product [Rotaria magnacalcarata]CAF2091235.1 unnamed protein product [Rotaria magnacalcarata]CAF3755482.1 unnamed protein product [Rotaria magnacalcarata]
MRNNEKPKLHENIKQEIRSLLISSPKTKYGGLTGSLLYSDYKTLNCGKEVPYAELGYHSFLALLRSMPDVVRIECKENSISYRVHPVYDETTAHIQKMVFEQRDKYKPQNRSYNQNWQSNTNMKQNKFTAFTFYHHTQLPFFNNSSFDFPQKVFISNDQRKQNSFLTTSSKSTIYKNQTDMINIQTMDMLPHEPLMSINNHEHCSHESTCLETPPNFDLNDYYLDELNTMSEKDIKEVNNNNSSIDNNINLSDDPFLTTSPDRILNDLVKSTTDQSLMPSTTSIINSSVAKVFSNKNILSAITDEHRSNNSIHPIQSRLTILEEEKLQSNKENLFEISRCNKKEQSNMDEHSKLIKRIYDAQYQCIHFRYIHRLYQIKFEYRDYPSSRETSLMKYKLEEIAYDKHQQDLEECENIFRLNEPFDEQKCETMFNEYIYLQRNYYYMMKLMTKMKMNRKNLHLLLKKNSRYFMS